MIWLQFAVSSVIIVLAANRLALYGDAIAVHTRLSGMFIGALLLASATSLPELLTAISAVNEGEPNLTAGNIFGSNMFNVLLLAVLDLSYWRSRFLQRLGLAHALSAGLAVAITGLAMFFILAQIDVAIGWVGLDSLALIGAYVLFTRLLFTSASGDSAPPAETNAPDNDLPSLRHALIGFAAGALVLVIVTPILVRSAVRIAEETGLGTGFVGVALVAVITSLPEVVTSIAAARIGAYELAAGNLFGSNLFNIFALGATDLFFTDGRFLAQLSPAMTLAGIIALLLTQVALLGNLLRNIAPRETRWLVVEVDSLVIVIGYIGGMILIYDRGLIG